MLKEQKKHIDKEQGKTKHEAPLSVNYRATHNKNLTNMANIKHVCFLFTVYITTNITQNNLTLRVSLS